MCISVPLTWRRSHRRGFFCEFWKNFQISFFVELLGRTFVSDTLVLIINHWTVGNTLFTEAATRGVLCKDMFFKIFQIYRKTSAPESLLKLQNFSCSCRFLGKYSDSHQTSKMELFAKTAAENYFRKKLHLRCLTGFYLRF